MCSLSQEFGVCSITVVSASHWLKSFVVLAAILLLSKQFFASKFGIQNQSQTHYALLFVLKLSSAWLVSN